MLTAAFYDQEIVDALDVKNALATAKSDIFHICPTDTAWPENMAAETELIWSSRDQRFREILMQRFEDIRHSTGPLMFQGADLLEVIRYDWIAATENAYWRYWAVCELVARYRPHRLLWTTTHPQYLPIVRAACDDAGLSLLVKCPSRDRLRYRVQRTFDQFRDYLWFWYDRRRTRKQSQVIASCRPNQQRSDVVIAEFFPNSAEVSLRAANAFENLAGLPVAFVGGRAAVCDFLISKGRPCFHMEEFRVAADKSSRNAIDGLNRTLGAAVRSVICKPRGNDARQRLRIRRSVDPLMNEIAGRQRELVRAAVEWIDLFYSMIDRLQPRILITTTFSGSFGRALAFAAHSKGIGSIYIQHGLTGETEYFSHVPHRRILLWGQSILRAYQAAGISPERMRVVGSPIYESVANHRNAASDAKPISEHPVGCRVLLLGSRPGGYYVNTAVFERILRATGEATFSIPGASLIVKLHPSDHSGIAERVFGGNRNVTLVKKGELSFWLRQCDVAIVTSSTTGMEACMFDIPLVEFNPTGNEIPVEYYNYGAAIPVRNASDLATAIHNALHDEGVREQLRQGRRRLIDDVLNGGNSDASLRVASEVLDVLNDTHEATAQSQGRSSLPVVPE